jgi:hypothetical protein
VTDENKLQPPARPAAPPAAPQEQTAATAPPTPPQFAAPPPSPPTQHQGGTQQNGQQGAAQQPWQQQQQQAAGQQSWQQTHERLQQQAGGGAPTWEQLKAAGNYQIPPEYPADKFNPESFSVPALLLSWIWYMVKGMWQKGVVILGAMLVVSRVPFLSLPLVIGVTIYAGIYGHRDYMRYHNNNKQQFWF